MTGAHLVALVEQAARQRGLPINDFARPLSSDPNGWLEQLTLAIRPQTWTIARVRALIEGRPIPETPRHQIPNGLSISRAERARRGMEPSGRSRIEREAIVRQTATRRADEHRLALSRKAHELRQPGETLAACAARLAKEQHA